jgi:muramoyltetrapeptide carboxypeptidase
LPHRRVRVDAAGSHLDFQLIADHPKAFCGYSDITALHVALRQRAGLATF